MKHWMLILVLVGLAAESRGDFVLWDNEQLTVNNSHSKGTLCDQSQVDVGAQGSVSYLNAYSASIVNFNGHSIRLYAYNTSAVSGCGVFRNDPWWPHRDRLYSFDGCFSGVLFSVVGDKIHATFAEVLVK